MTYNEGEAFAAFATIIGGIIGWFSVKWIEKRLGCKDDWELMSLVRRKKNSLWQAGPKQGN